VKPPAYIAAHIRRVLVDGGSAPHAEGVQRFFKEQVASRGWYTGELRKLAARFHRVLLAEHGFEYLVRVADQLFRGDVLEEKVMAALLLEKSAAQFGPKEFRLFDDWLDRVSSWADHDALAHYLLAPMLVADPARVRVVFRWARSRNHWRRRAACVSLIRGARQGMFYDEAARLADFFCGAGALARENDPDLMVQKGLGWLLREMAKADAWRTLPLLLKIRDRAPRLVLRTACETLDVKTRARVLAVA
jgi:3-methyladenine DNA glycosylase AlkD